ncbi:MAG: hypothetical protein FWH06_00245 [Oscillospiraceae bacterium]|nr:hypothetical protein [Oscillospiraceae bacterium]
MTSLFFYTAIMDGGALCYAKKIAEVREMLPSFRTHKIGGEKDENVTAACTL